MRPKYYIFLIVSIVTIVIFIFFNNHFLNINFTSFYDKTNQIDRTYKVLENTEESFAATKKLPTGENIIFTSVFDSSSVTIYNSEHVYLYYIEDNKLVLDTAQDSNYNDICDPVCSGDIKVEEFFMRGKVIQELERFY